MGNKNSGRRPQPTALTVLRGNPSKKRLNESEPKPPQGVVVKPAGLSTGAALVWDRLAPVCLAMGTMTVADEEAFSTLCELRATFLTNTAKKGRKGADFDAKLESDLGNKLRPYWAMFGLEPSSRARLQVPQKAEAPVSKWAGALK